MSGIYGKHLNGGSQFIKHPSAVINKYKMKFTVENPKSEDVLREVPEEPIRTFDEKLNNSKNENRIKEDNKSKTLLVNKLNRYDKLSKENLRRKKNQSKEKEVIKISIKKMQNKIDELSEVIRKKVSTPTKEQEECALDTKKEIDYQQNVAKFNKIKTMQGLFLVAGILLYSLILVIILDEHDQTANADNINIPKLTQRKSLVEYLLNISTK